MRLIHIKNMFENDESSNCKKGGDHHNQPIRYLCMEQDCSTDRLLCRSCVHQFHKKHNLATLDKFVEPLARLNMNSQTENAEDYFLLFQDTINSISDCWSKLNKIIQGHFQRIEKDLLYQFQAISETFAEETIDKVSKKLNLQTASTEEINAMVDTIQFLGKKDFNQPEKLKQISLCIKENICESLENSFRKIDFILKSIHQKTSKYNFLNPEIDEIAHQFQDGEKSKSENKRITDEFSQAENEHENSHVMNEIKPMMKEMTKSMKLPRNDEGEEFCGLTKIEEIQRGYYDLESAESQTQIELGIENNDKVDSMNQQARDKITKVVVNYCNNPDEQLSKILTFRNLQELEIFWFELAKKEFLQKYIYNLSHLRSLILNCSNEFDEECSRWIPKKLPKIEKLEYGWDYMNSLKQYDDNIYFRMSPYTNRGFPLRMSSTREMAANLKKLRNIWIGDFVYFRCSTKEISFKNMKEFTLGQTKGKSFKISEKLIVQLKEMNQLLCLTLLHIKIDEKSLEQILVRNKWLKTFVVEGCDDITDSSLKVLAEHCCITKLCIRESKIEGIPIWNMPNIDTLILVECNKINDGKANEGIKRLKYLQYLNLYGCKWVGNFFIKNISNLKAIEGLNIGRTSLTDACADSLLQMVNMKTICFDCTQINGDVVAKMSNYATAIEKLSLWGLDGEMGFGMITDEHIKVISKNLSHLIHLSIKYCKPLDENTFRDFGSLRILQIDRSNLSLDMQDELQFKGIKILMDMEEAQNV